MQLEKLKISGMSCMHCVQSVKDELSKLDLHIKKVGIGFAEVEFDQSSVTLNQIKKAIKKAGYTLIEN